MAELEANDRSSSGILRVCSALASGGALAVLACRRAFPQLGLTVDPAGRLLAPDMPPPAVWVALLGCAFLSSVCSPRRIVWHALAACVGLALIWIVVAAIRVRSGFTLGELVPPLAIWLLMYGYWFFAAPRESSSASSAQASVAGDTCCIYCGYNLRTLPSGGQCPECGQAVAPSLEGNRYSVSDGWFALRLRAGALAVSITCLAWACLDATVRIPRLWNALWSFTPATVLWIQFGLIGATGVGWWALTARTTPFPTDHAVFARWLSRLFVLLSAVWFFAALLDFISIQQGWDMPLWMNVGPRVAGNRLEMVSLVSWAFALWFLIAALGGILPSRWGRWLGIATLLVASAIPISPLLNLALHHAVFENLPDSTRSIASITIDLVISNTLVVWLGLFLAWFGVRVSSATSPAPSSSLR